MLRDAQTGMHKLVVCGLSKLGNAAWAEGIEFSPQGAAFTLNGQHRFESNLLGRHNVLNCVMALQAALLLGVEVPRLQTALKAFKPVPGRLSLKEIDGVHFLDDSYNSNPGSFRAAVQTLEDLRSNGKKGIVCGDMLELGTHTERLHRELGGFIAAADPDFLIAAGKNSKFLVEEAKKRGYDGQKLFHTADSTEAGQVARKMVSSGDLVLVKGSRGMQMEKVFECFTSSYTR
jgi:UDP-N-acetylmuramoyl-tripeptide--D-alanyl-D-alanine ligase